MSASLPSRRTCPGTSAQPVSPAVDLAEHLLRACIVLELQRAPSSSAQLRRRLEPFSMDGETGDLQGLLEAMEGAGLLFSTWGPHASEPERHTFHVTPAGSEWLSSAVRDLHDSEAFVGVFVARYQERFVTSR